MDHILHRLGHAAGGRKAHTGGRRLIIGGHIRDLAEVDILCLQHTSQFLKGQHKIHITANGTAAGLQFLGRTGADKGNSAVRMPLFLQPCRQHHGGHGHGNIGRSAGELLLGHHRPRRAAGSSHIGLHLGHMGHKLLCLLNGAQIRSDGHLLHRLEAQYLHSRNDLSGSHIFAELPPKSRSNDGNHLVTAADGVDKLEQLSLIHNSAEGAVHQTHTAADALVLVDLRPAVLILADGVHAVGEAPFLAAEHRGPAAVVDGVEVGAHGHGPGLQVGVTRQGLVFRDSGGTALRHPLDALAKQLRQAPDGDHGPSVDHPGQILRIHPVAVQRHVGPGLGDLRLRLFLGGAGVDGGPFRLRHHL